METTIVTTGLITNQTPELSANPHECHEFNYIIEFTETVNVMEHVEWYYSGDFPLGLNLDPELGRISGIIYPLHKQPACQDNLSPDEPLNPDGSNRNSMGLFNGSTFTFEFNILRDYLIEDPLFPGDDTKYILETVESPVSILVIRSGNIFNTVFMEKFVNTPDTEVNKILLDITGNVGLEVVIEKAHITYDGVYYYKEDLEKLYQTHPGPFATCPVIEE